MPTRKATAVWEGPLRGGKGTFNGQTGLGGTYSFGSRFEEGVAGSNPEELLAAAHAACFSMALGAALEKNGTPATRVQTEGACTLEKVGDGMAITRLRLTTRASVPGIEPQKFQELAESTKDNCLVSRALKAVPMELDATLI